MVESLEIERDIYRTLALRHEARIAELAEELRYVAKYLPAEVNEHARAVLNAPANAELPEGVTQEDLDAAIPLPPLGDSRRPAQSPAGAMRSALERCRTVLANMALENKGAFHWNRWPISHEPLRNDARNLLPVIDEALDSGEPR